jgi:hypothetical protein
LVPLTSGWHAEGCDDANVSVVDREYPFGGEAQRPGVGTQGSCKSNQMTPPPIPSIRDDVALLLPRRSMLS